MDQPLSVSVRSQVLTITIHAPGTRNALSFAVLDAVESALLSADRGLRGAVLTGHGGLFSAGADFTSLTGTEKDVRYDERVDELVKVILELPWPVVAAIEGACMGAAADIALACDFRVVADDAFMEIPAARLGIIYNPASLRRLQARYPDGILRRLLLLGERIRAVQALSTGLATHSAGNGQAVEVSQAILADGPARSSAAVAGMRLILNNPDAPIELGSAADMDRRRLLATPERREAIVQRQPSSTDREHKRTDPGA
jgi:enoyl-CoA hydratase